MGEARRRLDYVRRNVLKEMQGWMFPPTPEERELYEEIEAMPMVMVQKADQSAIDYMGMVVGECHANCAWYVRENEYQPIGNGPMKLVSGWIVDGHRYLHHSVVYLSDRDAYYCVTPFYQHITHFWMALDPKIKVEIDEVRNLVITSRNGKPLPRGVRRDPEGWIAYHAEVLAGRQHITLANGQKITGPLS